MTVDTSATTTSARHGLAVRSGLSATALAVTAVGFAAVAAVVGDGHTATVDSGILAEAVEHRHGLLTGFFETVSSAAEIPLALVVAVFAGALAWWARSWAPLVLASLAGAGSTALATVVKDVAGRARPAVWWQVLPETGFSFPSRHTTVATALLLVAAYLLAQRARTRTTTVTPWIAALALAALVAASRVYLGVHWASDVTAAACLGTAWALALITAHLVLRLRSQSGGRWSAGQ